MAEDVEWLNKNKEYKMGKKSTSDATDTDATPSRKESAESLKTEAEIASFFGVSHRTLERWRKSGKIKCYRMNGEPRYSMEKHVEPFLTSCETKTKARRGKHSNQPQGDLSLKP